MNHHDRHLKRVQRNHERRMIFIKRDRDRAKQKEHNQCLKRYRALSGYKNHNYNVMLFNTHHTINNMSQITLDLTWIDDPMSEISRSQSVVSKDRFNYKFTRETRGNRIPYSSVKSHLQAADVIIDFTNSNYLYSPTLVTCLQKTPPNAYSDEHEMQKHKKEFIDGKSDSPYVQMLLNAFKDKTTQLDRRYIWNNQINEFHWNLRQVLDLQNTQTTIAIKIILELELELTDMSTIIAHLQRIIISKYTDKPIIYALSGTSSNWERFSKKSDRVNVMVIGNSIDFTLLEQCCVQHLKK